MYAGAQRVLAAERTIAAMIDGPRNRLFRKGMFGARPLGTITVFLHRHQAHRALDLHPAVSHFFRLWLWLTTGRVTKEWAAIHPGSCPACWYPQAVLLLAACRMLKPDRLLA